MSTENKPTPTLREEMAAVLKEKGEPMTTTQITEAVIKRALWKTAGKTPEATVAAHLSVDAKKEDGWFEKVDKGTFKVRDGVDTSVKAKPEKKAAEPKPKKEPKEKRPVDKNGSGSKSTAKVPKGVEGVSFVHMQTEKDTEAPIEDLSKVSMNPTDKVCAEVDGTVYTAWQDGQGRYTLVGKDEAVKVSVSGFLKAGFQAKQSKKAVNVPTPEDGIPSAHGPVKVFTENQKAALAYLAEIVTAAKAPAEPATAGATS